MSFITSINLSDYLSVLDWTVFIAVLLITFASIFYGQKLKKSSGVLETLLMGRRLTLPFSQQLLSLPGMEVFWRDKNCL